jgi:hypothetical protein
MNQFSQVQGERPDKELDRLMGDAGFGQVMSYDLRGSNRIPDLLFLRLWLPEWGSTLDHMIGS